MNNYYDYPYEKPYSGPTYEKDGSQTPVNSYEGFIRGNMFSELYHPYTNYEPFHLTPNNERESLLQKVMELNFANTDLNFYLDIYPDNQDMINLRAQYDTELKRCEEQYERKFGPLTVDSEVTKAYPWNWINAPWPWEVK